MREPATTPPTLQVRATAVIIRDDEVVLVRQDVQDSREWSLPGGRVERGETLSAACLREATEETGLVVRLDRFLYLTEDPSSSPPLLHVTFECTAVAGHLRTPSNLLDENPISEVRWVRIPDLDRFGFSPRFVSLISRRFPDAGSYEGLRSNIGL